MYKEGRNGEKGRQKRKGEEISNMISETKETTHNQRKRETESKPNS